MSVLLLTSCAQRKSTPAPDLDAIVNNAYLLLLEDRPDECIKLMCDSMTDSELLGSDVRLFTIGRAYYKLIKPEQMIDTMYTLDPAYRSNSVTVSDDNRHMIVSYGGSGMSRVYALPSMDVELSAQTPDTLYDAIMNPASSRVAIGGEGGRYYVYTFPEGRLEYEIKAHNSSIRDLTFVGNDTLLTASSDHYVRGWELDGGTQTWLLHPHTKAINRARVTPNHRLLVTSGDDGNAQLFNLTDVGNPKYQSYSMFNMSTKPLKDAYISPDGKFIVGASTDGQVRFYDVASHEMTGRIEAYHPVTGVKVGPDSRTVAAVAYDQAYLINPVKRQLFCRVDLKADSLNSIQYLDERRVMVADPTRVWIIKMPTSQELLQNCRALRGRL